METIKIEYSIGVKTICGWRKEYVTAIAEKLSEKRCKITSVEDIGGNGNVGYASRTGAKRQTYNVGFFARSEVGKVKNISSVKILENN